MKKLFLSMFSAGLAVAAQAQTITTYENIGIVNAPPDLPPQIDALNFINRNQFNITLTNVGYYTANTIVYQTANTLNYSNFNRMFASPGFQFATMPDNSGVKRMAANIHNSGMITVGTSSNSIITGLGILGGYSKLLASATNFYNPGVIDLGFESVCSIDAHNVNMQGGTLSMASQGYNNINGSLFFNGGLFDGYWGFGTNLLNGGFFYAQPPQSNAGIVTNRNYQGLYQNLTLPNALVYLDDQTVGSNRTVRAVFLSNTNADLATRVFLPTFASIGDIAVEWSTPVTNALGVISTNYLYLFDDFGPNSLHALFYNGYAGGAGGYYGAFGRPTYRPANYYFLQSTAPWFFFEPPATPTIIPGGTFPNGIVTNQWTAYEAMALPTSLVLADVAGQDVTNLPGRVTISAKNAMNLANARVTSLNYLNLSSPESFAGSAGAKIGAPYSDVTLRNTNGTLVITNLMVPAMPRPEGVIDCWSMRFSQVTAGITNDYHVLYVDTRVAPMTPTRIQSLVLRSTNYNGGPNSIIIKDALNVTRSLTLDCTDLTISTNEPGSPASSGALNMVNNSIIWSTATPRLRNLTNDGSIATFNAVFFGGSRSAPFYSSTYNEPYDSFVNRGSVTNYGSQIWAKYFENSGRFQMNSGGFELLSSGQAYLTNGSILAPDQFAYINIETDSLLVSNSVFITGGGLSLHAHEILDDGSVATPVEFVTNRNIWTVGGNISLPVRPTSASLAATTITNFSRSYQEQLITWAGQDKDATPAGFQNNAAIGRLILDGRDQDSVFLIGPANGQNALYIDYLELRNSVATNVNSLGEFQGLRVLPGMKVYYGQALANGVSVAEKLNGSGGFAWVSDYHTGFYSSTNIVYPDGTTNRFNTALVTSCDIDSDGDGIVNCLDPAPIAVLSPSAVALKARILEAGARKASISWNTFPNTANTLYAASSPTDSNWQLVTNFTVGATSGTVSVTEPVSTNSVRFYKVQVQAR